MDRATQSQMDFQNVTFQEAFQEAVSVSSNDLHSFTVTPPKSIMGWPSWAEPAVG